MHKRSKHGGKSNRNYHSDITIHDFANSTPGQHLGIRLKKQEKSVMISKKEVTVMKQEVEELAWYDKDLDEFDITVDGEGEGDQDIDNSATDLIVEKKPKRSSTRTSLPSCTGLVYPVDLWFQLSKAIHPEDIGRFAGLCRGTRSVTHTVQFWKHLYLRFYKEDHKLPDLLKSSSLDCVHGLRARVIRTLNFIYEPFVIRTKTTVPFENDPHRLVGQRCLLTWHKKVKNVWKFYFKFLKGDIADTSTNNPRGLKSPHFIKWHQDLFYNPDINCSVLEVTSPTFVSLPIIMGQILNRVYFNASSGSMMSQKLKLILDTNFRTTTLKNQGGMLEMTCDPVLEVRVYPWWDPQYQESQVSICNES